MTMLKTKYTPAIAYDAKTKQYTYLCENCYAKTYRRVAGVNGTVLCNKCRNINDSVGKALTGKLFKIRNILNNIEEKISNLDEITEESVKQIIEEEYEQYKIIVIEKYNDSTRFHKNKGLKVDDVTLEIIKKMGY